MNEEIDDLLKDALTPSEEPSAWLNQRIVQTAKGGKNMRKPFFKTVPAIAAIAVAVLATGGLTTYAAWNYLSMDQVAEVVENKTLADAFRGEDAIRINESQSYGDYKITLLGMVSGKNMTDYTTKENGVVVQNDRSYVVVSIEKKDGSAMPEDTGASDFLVTPFIKGKNPVNLNIYHMGGGASAFVQDGIKYYIFEMDSLEVFAKRGIYLGVLDDTFYDSNAYSFDEGTGEITRNENYDGVNALFNLPLDESKADEEAADEQLAKWKADFEGSEADEEKKTETDMESGGDDTESELEEWTPERLKKEAVLIKNSVKTYPASKYHKTITEGWSWNGMSMEGSLRPDTYFDEDEYGTKITGASGGDGDKMVIDTCTRSKDGSITVKAYHIK